MSFGLSSSPEDYSTSNPPPPRAAEAGRRTFRSELQQLNLAREPIKQLEARYRAVTQFVLLKAKKGYVTLEEATRIAEKIHLKPRQLRRLADRVREGKSLIRKHGSGSGIISINYLPLSEIGGQLGRISPCGTRPTVACAR